MTPQDFVAKWEHCPGSERANYAVFLTELCGVLGVSSPGPTDGYRIDAPVPGGAEAGGTGFIDCYKRDSFILEAKQSKICELPSLPGLAKADLGSPAAGTKYDELMRRAFRQARRYAVNLPADHPWPPFIIVLDVGRAFELYFDFAGNGRDYRFFPDRASYRIPIGALTDDAPIGPTKRSARALLAAIWSDPKRLDPRLVTADVTSKVARRLADVSKHIEEEIERDFKRGDLTPFQRELAVEEAALFLMRMLFCMFAEDVELLPKDGFSGFLKSCAVEERELSRLMDRERLEQGLGDLWTKMGDAHPPTRYTLALGSAVRYFNGGLFENRRVFPLSRNDLDALIDAAGHQWRDVEPAIFGSFLEQALSTEQRAKLGAHYTPRPYVERIVEATITDVLRPEWEAVEAGLEGIERTTALERLLGFQERLAAVAVLDPACGTGNFLYVAMEALLGLENKVLQAIEDLGGQAIGRIGPGQFHGLEKNPRAAKIAELVLWIGWLRWTIRNGAGGIGEPILGQRANINFGRPGGYDAVLAQDETGEPDLANPRRPVWPEADFIVGNPPFIGGKDLRGELGGDYAEALWKANKSVPASADFVMQWWDRAADLLTRDGTRLRRFGYVTTNSITQAFSRRVIEARLAAAAPADAATGLHLTLACPDHPWTRATKDAAAVRIAMTVAERGAGEGALLEIEHEARLDSDAPELRFGTFRGTINGNLGIGPDPSQATPLLANEGLSSRGVSLHGAGFIVTPSEAQMLGLGTREGLDAHIRPYRHGRDLMQHPRGAMVIDLFGLTEAEVRQRFPEVYQHLLRSVKADRDEQVVRSSTADAKAYAACWWIMGKSRPNLRDALSGLPRYMVTVETAKHRIFQLLDASILPDNMLVAIGSDDAFHFGVLSSRIHTQWAPRAGGWLGIGNDSRYSKSKVFDPFPFPDASPALRARIGELAEELDATRKTALAEVPRLTMTELYNLRERIAAGEALAGPDLARATAARAYIVHQLHEQIDAAVADAYGWPADLAPAEIVARLVALNAERRVEEAAGHVRWLRPEYQERRFGIKAATLRKTEGGTLPS